MDLTGKKVWHHSAGDGQRDYADVCLKWDVALVGPGDLGPWQDCGSDLHKQVGPRKLTVMKRFFEDVKDGDIVVLRIGTRAVAGVGSVVGGYSYHNLFGDVDGWELQHVRRVRWVWKAAGKPKRFEARTLKMGAACLAAKLQAEGYSKDKNNCSRLIVTDGLRYVVYVREDERFALHAYLNLTCMRDSYPIYDCKGAVKALAAMTPAWEPRRFTDG